MQKTSEMPGPFCSIFEDVDFGSKLRFPFSFFPRSCTNRNQQTCLSMMWTCKRGAPMQREKKNHAFPFFSNWCEVCTCKSFPFIAGNQTCSLVCNKWIHFSLSRWAGDSNIWIFYWSFVGKIRLEFGFGGNGLFSASQRLLFQFLGFPEDAWFTKLFVSARKPCDQFFAMISHQNLCSIFLVFSLWILVSIADFPASDWLSSILSE